MNWHSLSIEEVIRKKGADQKKGLSVKEVKLRQKKFGANKLPKGKPLSLFKIFLDQLQSPLIYILIIAGIVTLALGGYTDSVVIFGAVFLNVIIGLIQENKASKALEALKKIVKHKAEVLREKNLKVVDSAEVVLGDIIVLNSGDRIPADARLIENQNLKINEMALTGEWMPAKKTVEILSKETPLADRDNMVYMGCVVEDGKGRAVVTEIGSLTELGKIAEMVKETKEEKTPYQKKLARFSKFVGLGIGAICILVFIEGMITGGEFIEMFTISIAVAVAAIPEGLPAAMTIILALGMQRILKKKGLVRKLASAETLGSTSVIATDKTATLTLGRMKVNSVLDVSEILENKESKEKKLLALKTAALCVEAFAEKPESPEEELIIRGKPTDRALFRAGMEAGVSREEIDKRETRICDLPFDPIHKYSAAFYKISQEKYTLYVLGAPEKILPFCGLKKEDREKLEEKMEKLAEKGLRIVATASREIKSSESQTLDIKNKINNLSFVGFITLNDPIRKEAKKAIRICREAGMRLIIVTGDHKLTTKAIAGELGFMVRDENILNGNDMDSLSDEDFEKILPKIQIYARVEPKHKMRIVSMWQKRGEVVAMTGDGINDAPALKKADIGVSIGSGTEVAKETSDLILLNNSFSIIVAAVKEGRVIIDNIRKVITYLLSDSFTEIILIGASILLGVPLPVIAVQILWINLIEDGLPSAALAFEPKEKDIMKRKPGGHNIPLLTKEMKAIIFIIGIITDLILLWLFFWLLVQKCDILYIRTMIFACLTIDSLFYVFSCKSLRRNLWHINPFSNKLLIIAWAVGIMMLLVALYVPIFQNLLKTVPLGAGDWLIVLGLGAVKLILIEATKWYFITKPNPRLKIENTV